MNSAVILTLPPICCVYMILEEKSIASLLKEIIKRNLPKRKKASIT